MDRTILTLLGSQKSGLTLLAQLLEQLGLASIDAQSSLKVSAIHHLLLQDFGYTSTMVAALPRDWSSTRAAQHAKERIRHLVKSSRDKHSLPFLFDPFLAKFMPLWLEVLGEENLVPRYVFLIRHPWEVSQAIAADKVIDHAKAHILWLCHIRDAQLILQNQNHTLITFDQLLADPVTTLSKISGFRFSHLEPAYGYILEIVRSCDKKHHAGNLSNQEKLSFHPYESLYKRIYTDSYTRKSGKTETASAPNSKVFGLPSIEGLSAICVNGEQNLSSDIENIILSSNGTPCEIGLFDSLLSIIAQYEKQIVDTLAFQKQLADQSIQNLFIQAIFPSSFLDGQALKTVFITADEWQLVSVSVPEPEMIKKKAIVFIPLNICGTVLVSSIRLLNQANGDVLWQASSSKAFDELEISGKMIRLPDRNQLALAILGPNCRISLSIDQNIHDCPITIEMWIKVSVGFDEVQRCFGADSRKFVSNADVIQTYFTAKLKAMTDVWNFQRKFKARSDDFERGIRPRDNNALIQSETFWGSQIQLLPCNEFVSSKIYTFGFFDLELCTFFIDFLFEGAVLMDIGAHIGFFSMLGGELVGDEGSVYAFEPSPGTLAALRINVAPYTSVNVVPKMVWSSNTELDFQDFGIQFSAFNTAVSDRLSPEQKKQAPVRHIKVEAVGLDWFCKEHDIRPDVIKIDAESSEMQVLQGMVGLLDAVRPVVTLEVGDMESAIKDGVPCSSELIEFMKTFDYVPLNCVGGRYQLHMIQEQYAYDNIIMVPREKLPPRRPLISLVAQAGRFY